jgi:hypothetical protein
MEQGRHVGQFRHGRGHARRWPLGGAPLRRWPGALDPPQSPASGRGGRPEAIFPVWHAWRLTLIGLEAAKTLDGIAAGRARPAATGSGPDGRSTFRASNVRRRLPHDAGSHDGTGATRRIGRRDERLGDALAGHRHRVRTSTPRKVCRRLPDASRMEHFGRFPDSSFPFPLPRCPCVRIYRSPHAPASSRPLRPHRRNECVRVRFTRTPARSPASWTACVFTGNGNPDGTPRQVTVCAPLPPPCMRGLTDAGQQSIFASVRVLPTSSIRNGTGSGARSSP